MEVVVAKFMVLSQHVPRITYKYNKKSVTIDNLRAEISL